jgi:glucose-1-phosphate cytidylyltransferase
MKVVLLAGGFGTRLSEETDTKPKPMVEIGGRPILWHIMMIYAAHGFRDFMVCLGYKGYVIKEYFANLVLHNSDLDIDLKANRFEYLRGGGLPDWRVTLIDTGYGTLTGGRLKRVRHLLSPDEPFCMTYGDCVANVDIKRLLAFHSQHGLDATLTAVRPPARYGALVLDGTRVTRFVEKPAGDGGYINGGFFVLHPRVLDRIDGDSTAWEGKPLEDLAAEDQLSAFVHAGFWQPMDTLRDKNNLEKLWRDGEAPWKVWSSEDGSC